jgi:mono/diheme cytochrome c family protein
MKGPGLAGYFFFGAAALVLVLGWALNRPTPEPPSTSVAAPPEPVAEANQDSLDGAALYAQHCATCHMMDGHGVPNFQPGIVDGPVVAAGRDKVEAVIRAGSAALQDRPNPMGWEMPPLGTIGDAEIKALTDYVVATFGPNASSG